MDRSSLVRSISREVRVRLESLNTSGSRRVPKAVLRIFAMWVFPVTICRKDRTGISNTSTYLQGSQ